MTNTKFRRRALVSSVAMLLVAMLALGSATFAWFSADPNAKTKGLTLKAQSSTGLVIQSGTERAQDANWWTHEAVMNAGTKSGNSFPNGPAVAIGAASVNAGTDTLKGHIFRVDAAAEDNYIAADDGAVTDVTATPGANCYVENLYLKVTGAASSNVNIKKVTMTAGSTDLASAIRVAILKADNSVLGIWKPTSAAANNKYLMKEGTYKGTGVLSSGTYTGKVSGTAEDISVGTIDDGGDNYVKVIVYLDGEDSKVFSTGIASTDLSSVISSLVVEFKAE